MCNDTASYIYDKQQLQIFVAIRGFMDEELFELGKIIFPYDVTKCDEDGVYL